MKNDKIFFLVLIIILLIIPLLLRLLDLHADLPPFSSIGIANGDEGQYSYSARSKLLFGVWTPENDNYYVFHMLPFYTYLLYQFFTLTGVSITAIKLFSIMFGMGSIVLMYLGTRKSFNNTVAFIATVILAYDFVFVMYNRAGTVEIFLVFFLLLVYTLLAYTGENKAVAFLLGVSVFLAFFAKINGGFILLPVVLTLWLYHRKDYRLYLSSFTGLVVGFLGYIVWFVLPQATILATAVVKNFILYRLETNLLSSLLPLAYKIFTIGFSSPLFIRMPLVTLFSFLALSYLIKRLWYHRQEVSKMEFFLFSWIVTQVLVMLVLDASMRRIFLLLPPLMIFASLGLVNFFETPTESLPTSSWWKRVFLNFVNLMFLYMVLGNVAKLILRYTHGASVATTLFTALNLPATRYTENALLSGLAAVISALIVLPIGYSLSFLRSPLQRAVTTPFARRYGVPVVLIISVTISLLQYGWWYSHPTYTFFNAAQEMAALIPPSAIQGRMAPTLAIESRHYPVFIHLDKHINDQDRFERDDVRYFTLILRNDLLPLNEEENTRWLTAYPQAQLIKIFHFSDPEFAEVGLFDKYPNTKGMYSYPTTRGE